MKILALAEFDPAGVLGGHRRALRRLGLDYRLAVRDVYQPADHDDEAPDFAFARGGREPAIEFLASCDMLIFNPVIGQPWSYQLTERTPAPHETAWELVALAPSAVRRVAYFHGSRNTWVNRHWYAEHYRGLGFALAASTIDYATEMPAAYLPPLLEVPANLSARRGDGEPLRVVHAPSDPGNCHTREFWAAAIVTDCVPCTLTGTSHARVMEIKRTAHAGFDHLRGCFSVNTLENAALGLAPVVGIWKHYLPALDALGVATPPFGIRDPSELVTALRELREAPAWLEMSRRRARRWFTHEMVDLAARVKRLLEDI